MGRVIPEGFGNGSRLRRPSPVTTPLCIWNRWLQWGHEWARVRIATTGSTLSKAPGTQDSDNEPDPSHGREGESP